MSNDTADRLVDRTHRLLMIPCFPGQHARGARAAQPRAACRGRAPLVEILPLELDLGIERRRKRQTSDHDATARAVGKVDAFGQLAAAHSEQHRAARATEERGLDGILEGLNGRRAFGRVSRLDDERLELTQSLEHRRAAVG
jgi:hypothetical protein